MLGTTIGDPVLTSELGSTVRVTVWVDVVPESAYEVAGKLGVAAYEVLYPHHPTKGDPL